MKIPILLLISISVFGQATGYKLNVFTGLLDLAGNGYTSPSGYTSSAQTGITTLSVTAATHGQGTAPTAWCFDSATPAVATDCYYTVSAIGDVVFSFAPAFSGYVIIRGPGANAGAAGNFVGPASSTSGNLVSFSGTSGKIGADSGIAATTVVKGAASLTTPGAVPYVVSAGVLGQDVAINWNSSTKLLSVGGGTGSASPFISAVMQSGSSFTGYRWQLAGAVDSWSNSINTAGNMVFSRFTGAGVFQDNPVVMINATGNVILSKTTSGSPTDGNYKLDVQASGSTGTMKVGDLTPATGFTRVLFSLGAADSATTVTFTNAGTTKSAGYQSSDGSAGVTGATCSSFKNGLCVAP